MSEDTLYVNTFGISKEEIKDIIKEKYRYYNKLFLKKNNGTSRIIYAPIKKLKTVQKYLLKNVFYSVRAHDAAYGFVRNKSQVKAAEQHIGAERVICFDLQDFFPSINSFDVNYVINYLKNKELPKFKDLTDDLIDDIVSIVTLKGHTPQGVPTSPLLSNLVFFYYDTLFAKFAKEHDLVYTRYADDLVFSSKDKNFNINTIYSSQAYKKLTRKFSINTRKTKNYFSNQRKLVNGVVVNTSNLGVKREYKNILRAIIHNYIKNGATKEQLEELKGKLSWINSINKTCYKKYAAKIGMIPLLNLKIT